MAIFRAETKSISRGKGHNLVAALSYRAGMALTDTNEFNPNATTHDYTRKTDVVHREILIPRALKKKLDDVDIALDFQYIANLVETGETTLRGKMKSTARLGREWVLCGVPELSRAENIELFQQFAKEQGEEQGVISMCFVHDPKAGNDTRSKSGAANSSANDERNIHAHIVLLTRKLELTDTNTLKLGDKSDSELSNDERTRPVVPKELVATIDPATNQKIQQGRGLCSNSDWLKNTRKSWADILNKKLLEKGVQPVTHKSYRELGLNIVPTVHVGNNELSESKRVQNERINKRNESAVKSAADSYITESVRRIELSDTSYDRVTALNRTQARTRDTASERARDATASSTANERIRDSERVIEEQVRRIKHSNIVYNRVADFRAARTRTSDRASERTRERERLIAQSISRQGFYRNTFASAARCHESNIRLIASRLAWRKTYSAKYDDRQMKELDTFYGKLGVKDFTLSELIESRDDCTNSIKDKLTDEIIINNSKIIAIVRDPVAELENYLAKTSQNAPDSVEMRKTQNSSLESSKALESAVETYERPINRFRL